MNKNTSIFTIYWPNFSLNFADRSQNCNKGLQSISQYVQVLSQYMAWPIAILSVTSNCNNSCRFGQHFLSYTANTHCFRYASDNSRLIKIICTLFSVFYTTACLSQTLNITPVIYYVASYNDQQRTYAHNDYRYYDIILQKAWYW